jgi:nicotinamidase-related amidase
LQITLSPTSGPFPQALERGIFGKHPFWAIMNPDELFDALDLGRDGELSRRELHDAARRLGWHWRQAPVYAVLDLLTIGAPLSKSAFISCMADIIQDPQGPYGRVLRRGPRIPELPLPDGEAEVHWEAEAAENAVELLADLEGQETAAAYAALFERLDEARPAVRSDATALLIIDPQRSFTSGAWMHSMGPSGDHEVMPIRLAFENCARWLGAFHHRVETMFTRCPFPPDSYDWDERLSGIIDDTQLYFVKPGNSVMWPPSNGFAQWLEDLLRRGKKTVVMGGCTLNSCLRVSAIEAQRRFRNDALEVVVDLSLCGARTRNYLESPFFRGTSSVGFAIREMVASGVTVAERVEWR